MKPIYFILLSNSILLLTGCKSECDCFQNDYEKLLVEATFSEKDLKKEDVQIDCFGNGYCSAKYRGTKEDIISIISLKNLKESINDKTFFLKPYEIHRYRILIYNSKDANSEYITNLINNVSQKNKKQVDALFYERQTKNVFIRFKYDALLVKYKFNNIKHVKK
jgi:hypothetical protein